MKKKFKKTGAALLIAGLTVTGTSYAWANEKTSEPIDLSVLNEDSTTDVVESPELVEVPVEEVEEVVNEDETTVDDETNKEETEETEETEVAEDAEGTEDDTDKVEESVLPEVPEGYTAGNLVALGKAYEKVQNPTAKAAIKRNMERSIDKFENNQQEEEAPEQPVEDKVKQETPVKNENAANVNQTKAPQAQLNAQHKEQRQELKASQKTEREALKAERKADKEQQKQENKDQKN